MFFPGIPGHADARIQQTIHDIQHQHDADIHGRIEDTQRENVIIIDTFSGDGIDHQFADTLAYYTLLQPAVVGGKTCYVNPNIDAYCGEDAEITIPETVNGVPVTAWSLGEAPSVTALTLPASLADASNRDGLSGLNRLPKLTSITLDGKSDSGFVSGSAVYLSDGTMTELIAAARQREGRAWSIPEGVTSIGTGIVCDTAKSLILPASLQNADGNMILSALENVTAAKGNTSFRVIGGALYHLGENGKPDSLVLLPEKSGIKALDIPEGVRQVGKLRCDTLEAICFPASAQTITTFSHGIGSSRLSALREIDVAAGNPCFTSEYGVLYGVECSIDEARGTFVATDGGKPAYFAACPDSYPSETLTLPDSVSGFIAPLTCDAVRAVVFPKNWKTDSESGDIRLSEKLENRLRERRYPLLSQRA